MRNEIIVGVGRDHSPHLIKILTLLLTILTFRYDIVRNIFELNTYEIGYILTLGSLVKVRDS